MSREEYLLADHPSELERLQLQARVWEPSGRQLLTEVGDGSGLRALDVGCGAVGWLRILSEWVGPSGQVVGADTDERFARLRRLERVTLRRLDRGHLGLDLVCEGRSTSSERGRVEASRQHRRTG